MKLSGSLAVGLRCCVVFLILAGLAPFAISPLPVFNDGSSTLPCKDQFGNRYTETSNNTNGNSFDFQGRQISCETTGWSNSRRLLRMATT